MADCLQCRIIALALMGPNKVSVIQSIGVPALQEVLVYGDVFQTLRLLSVILQVSAIKGCPLNRFHFLYS